MGRSPPQLPSPPRPHTSRHPPRPPPDNSSKAILPSRLHGSRTLAVLLHFKVLFLVCCLLSLRNWRFLAKSSTLRWGATSSSIVAEKEPRLAGELESAIEEKQVGKRKKPNVEQKEEDKRTHAGELESFIEEKQESGTKPEVEHKEEDKRTHANRLESGTMQISSESAKRKAYARHALDRVEKAHKKLLMEDNYTPVKLNYREG
jgi:hypothetical protein